jgi:hypothetical protein
VVEVPYEKVVYQDKVEFQYIDVERVVEHIVRKEVPGLLFVVTKSRNFGFAKLLTCLYLGSPDLNESDDDGAEPLELTVLSLSVSSLSLCPSAYLCVCFSPSLRLSLTSSSHSPYLTIFLSLPLPPSLPHPPSLSLSLLPHTSHTFVPNRTSCAP